MDIREDYTIQTEYRVVDAANVRVAYDLQKILDDNAGWMYHELVISPHFRLVILKRPKIS